MRIAWKRNSMLGNGQWNSIASWFGSKNEQFCMSHSTHPKEFLAYGPCDPNNCNYGSISCLGSLYNLVHSSTPPRLCWWWNFQLHAGEAAAVERLHWAATTLLKLKTLNMCENEELRGSLLHRAVVSFFHRRSCHGPIILLFSVLQFSASKQTSKQTFAFLYSFDWSRTR